VTNTYTPDYAVGSDGNSQIHSYVVPGISQTITANYGAVTLKPVKYQVASYIYLNGRTILQESFRVTIANQGSLNIKAVSADISSYPGYITVVDGKVTLGNINAGASIVSGDTSTVRLNLSFVPNITTALNAVTWKITYTIGSTVYTLDNVQQ
jgi:hypothetical protein